MGPYHLRILHLSDLHERVALGWMPDDRKCRIQAMRANRYRVLNGSGFFGILSGIRAAGRIDLVCFTGDAADWGLDAEFARATRRLDDILAAAGVSRDRLFVVPGNHDVCRENEGGPRARCAWRQMLRLAQENPEALSQWMADLDAPHRARAAWRDDLLSRTEAYRRWVAEELGRPCLLPEDSPHGLLGYRGALTNLGLPFPVHLVGLDTAWLSGHADEQGSLLLTPHQAELLVTDRAGAPLPGFRVALAHHPLSCLADGPEALRRLAGRVDLLLHGHQRGPAPQEVQDPDSRLLTLAAGCLYEGDPGEMRENTFHVVDVTLDESGLPLHCDVQSWRWSECGRWCRNRPLFGEAKEGRLMWRALPIERAPK